MTVTATALESIHPSLWRASQLARGRGRALDTGYPLLSAELPDGGWPLGGLVELLVQEGGVGELRLLQPALKLVGARCVALLQPPQVPHCLGLAHIGVSIRTVMHIKAPKTADALWSAEQILRTGSCGALLYWAQHVQASSLRRLHLAAQASDTLFVMLRPLAVAQDASPAILRLALKAAAGGLTVEIVKRRGPVGIEPLNIQLQPTPVLLSPRAAPSGQLLQWPFHVSRWSWRIEVNPAATAVRFPGVLGAAFLAAAERVLRASRPLDRGSRKT